MSLYLRLSTSLVGVNSKYPENSPWVSIAVVFVPRGELRLGDGKGLVGDTVLSCLL